MNLKHIPPAHTGYIDYINCHDIRWVANLISSQQLDNFCAFRVYCGISESTEKLLKFA